MPAVVETEEKLHLAFWIKWLTAKGPFGVKAFRISRMRMMTTTTMEGTATALCRTIMKSADCSSRHEYKGMFYQPKQTRAAILACCNSCLLQL